MTEKKRGVLSQHQELDYESDRLRLLTSAAPEALENGRARQVIERELRSFIEKLRAHFRYEEKDGYMKGVKLDKPHLAEQVDRLRDDHEHMRGEMDALEAASFEDSNCREFQDRILRFLDHVRGHEQAENEVLERFITEEYGR